MKNVVNIKGIKSGVIIVIKPEATFEEVKEALIAKLKLSASFLGNAQITLGFEGRKMSTDEMFEVMDIIEDMTELEIICISDNDPEVERSMNRSLYKMLFDFSNINGKFYKGNLLPGEVVDFETSVVVLGDVHPGAKIASKGNIVILGKLEGYAFAGAGGNESAFVAALNMNEPKIRIGDTKKAAPVKKRFFGKSKNNGPKIAVSRNGMIYKEDISADLMSDIDI